MKNRDVYKKILEAREKKNKNLNHASLEMETSTHMPLLIRMVQQSQGTILELGSGLFSTPLLHWLCFDNKRKLITYENYKHYWDFAKKFQTDTHEIRFVKDWSKEEFSDHYGVVLIDHSINNRQHSRGDDALRFKDNADYVILHDAGDNSNPKYGYDQVYPHFKYRLDWIGCKPHTTVLSNFYAIS